MSRNKNNTGGLEVTIVACAFIIIICAGAAIIATVLS